MYKKIIVFLLFFYINLLAQGSAEGTRIDLTRKLWLNPDNGQFAQLFIPDYFQVPPDERFIFVVHFHSASWAAEDEVYRSGTNAILFNIHLGAFSSPYSTYFSNAYRFRTIKDTVKSVLRRRGIMQNPQFKWVIVTSFSAGYAAVRELLKWQENFDRIDALTLADGLHSSSDPIVMIEQLRDFLRYAKVARNEKKVFLLTHSSIQTEGYASTTETANYLINGLGAQREPWSATDAIGTQYSRCDTGYFHLKGYLGTTAPDHLQHLYNMHLMLGRAVQLLDSIALKIPGQNITPEEHGSLNVYPNPFNPSTTIYYLLTKAGPVELGLFDVSGRKLYTLRYGYQPVGEHRYRFDATNLASGTYFCVLNTADEILRSRLLLVK